MSKSKEVIPAGRKAEILKELQKPERSMAAIARAYNVSKQSLWRWRKADKLGYDSSREMEKAVSREGNNFVEVAVREAEASLEKATLNFDKFSISIEGKISSRTLLGIIKLLEGAC